MSEAKCDNKWEIESAADTLIRAAEIRSDKKLYPKVKRELKRKAAVAHRAALEARVAGKMREAFPD